MAVSVASTGGTVNVPDSYNAIDITPRWHFPGP
jgi:hypothetical protein